MLFHAVFVLVFVKFTVFGCEKYFTASDCQEARDFGFSTSGIYNIRPMGTYEGLDVYCDMETDGGGWLVFQRRKDGSVDFYREWEYYQYGFGNVSGEHWLGNLALYTILLQGHYELRIDIEDLEGNHTFANYRYFTLDNPAKLFTLVVAEYSGTAGMYQLWVSSLNRQEGDFLSSSSGTAFATKDKGSSFGPSNCAKMFEGAWWFTSYCDNANFNSNFLYNGSDSQSIVHLRTVEMKIRRLYLRRPVYLRF